MLRFLVYILVEGYLSVLEVCNLQISLFHWAMESLATSV